MCLEQEPKKTELDRGKSKVESRRVVDSIRLNTYEILKLPVAQGSSRIIITLSNLILIPF
ncbi:hypothetical protein F383_19869 [Gossypium arboreum]|uniref:Uncharacterized protein n=1 Tax=Gossypium arboreum TaxID=29729 RepID=A0A0B0NNN0_GOSAR|nr:hypothetical protein F383_19869 [Gossypium arboreum]